MCKKEEQVGFNYTFKRMGINEEGGKGGGTTTRRDFYSILSFRVILFSFIIKRWDIKISRRAFPKKILSWFDNRTATNNKQPRGQRGYLEVINRITKHTL